MATANGVSSVGFQTIVQMTNPTARRFSIRDTNGSIGTPTRLGYFYLYEYATAAPFLEFVVQQGIIYKPGIRGVIEVPVQGATWGNRLIVNWNVSGYFWTASLT